MAVELSRGFTSPRMSEYEMFSQYRMTKDTALRDEIVENYIYIAEILSFPLKIYKLLKKRKRRQRKTRIPKRKARYLKRY